MNSMINTSKSCFGVGRYVCFQVQNIYLPIKTLNRDLLFSLAFGLLYKHTTSFCRIFIIVITIPYFCSTQNDECKTNTVSNKCIHGDQTTNSKAQHGEQKLAVIETTPSKCWCKVKERLMQLEGSQ